MADGWTAQQVFEGPQGLGLDEVVFLPAPNSKASFQVDLATRITRNIELRWPFMTGPAHTVTEANMAIAMALQGGLGIIHRHQSIADQAAMVRQVKTYSTGFILHCHTLKPWSTVGDGMKMQSQYDISCIPITDNGRVGGKLMGIVTRRDLEAVDDVTLPVKACMQRDVLYVREPVAIKQAREVMAKARVSKLPVVNKDKELVALLCRGDIKREQEHPNASRDANRSLIAAAAVNPLEKDAWERMETLLAAGMDLLCIDTDDGVMPDTMHFIKRVKDVYEGLDVLAGRIWSHRQAKDLCDAGADGLRVGLADHRDASALYEIAGLARQHPYEVPVMADFAAGDLSGVLKALLLGATSVGLDGMLVGSEEAPGDHIYHEGARVKLGPVGMVNNTRHLVNLGAPSAAAVRGSVSDIVPRLAEQLQICMRELGVASLKDVPQALSSGTLRMERQLHTVKEKASEHPPLQRVAVSTLHCRW